MNDAIAQMIKQPGRYAITSPALNRLGGYYVVEVEPDGTVHQLTQYGKRDGILRPDRWVGDEYILQFVPHLVTLR